MIGVQGPGGTTREVRSDLFVVRPDGREVYFEMKTVQPNRGTWEEMKRKMLMIMAMRSEFGAEAYAAMSYNRFGDEKIFKDGFNKYLEVGKDLLVGRQFWSFIGDEYTYDELLEIATEIGKETLLLLTEGEDS